MKKAIIGKYYSNKEAAEKAYAIPNRKKWVIIEFKNGYMIINRKQLDESGN